jgi:hypothetical protein
MKIQTAQELRVIQKRIIAARCRGIALLFGGNFQPQAKRVSSYRK